MSKRNKILIQEIDNEFETLPKEIVEGIRFERLSGQYKLKDDIFVAYEICNDFKPSTRDWIGLYKESEGNVTSYLTFQWAPSYPRDEKFPNIRSVLFPSSDIQYSLKTNGDTKYLFMYISMANRILAKSSKFYISDLVKNDYIKNDDAVADLASFAFVDSNPENLDIVENWFNRDILSSAPENFDIHVGKSLDRVSLNSNFSPTGKTLLEIFNTRSTSSTKAGEVPTSLENLIYKDAAKGKKNLITTVQTESPEQEAHARDVDLEALRVELDFVDKNLEQQTNLVAKLSSKVKNLSAGNHNLKTSNEKLSQSVRTLTLQKQSLEADVGKHTSRITELQTIVRLQKKGNRNLEKELDEAHRNSGKNGKLIESLRNDLDKQEKTNQELIRELDNMISKEQVVANNIDSETDDWTIASNRKAERKQKLIDKLENKLLEEKQRLDQLQTKLKESEMQILKLQETVCENQKREEKLCEKIQEDKDISIELRSRITDLSNDLNKLKEEKSVLAQEVAIIKRQKMKIKSHLVERETELMTRIRSLQDALKAAKLINKRTDRQQKTMETFSQTNVSTSNTNTQTPSKKLEDKACHVKSNNVMKTQTWEEFFQSFTDAWNNITEQEPADQSSVTKQSINLQENNSTNQDALFPFSEFPLVDEDEIGQSQEPSDLTIERSLSENSSSTTSSSASTQSSDTQEVADEAEELSPLLSGCFNTKYTEGNPSLRRKTPGNSVVADVILTQPEQKKRHEKDTKRLEAKKAPRRFVCCTRRLKYPSAPSSVKGRGAAKGFPWKINITK